MISKSKFMASAESALEKKVARVVSEEAESVESYIQDLQSSGCQSGMVDELIYYTDTVKFYKKYKEEIVAILVETMDGLGESGPAGVFGKKWDKDDPFADEQFNQNLLAWFAFEETAFNLARKCGMEI